MSNQLKRRTQCIGIISALLLSAISLLGPLPRVKAATFDAGNLIGDSNFTNKDSMSAGDIQAFLQAKGSVLAGVSSDQLGVEAVGRSAAQIIYDATRGSRTDFVTSIYGPSNPLVITLNPRVILVTLQKEQSLITGNYVAGSGVTNTALNAAMGYGCPDSGGCNPAYAGFTNQIVYAAAQFMYNYYRAASSSYKPGQAYTISNTTGAPYYAPATQQVTIGNASTSSLYAYTPHVYNGNYNFWYYMNNWFGLSTIDQTIPHVIRGSGPQAYLYIPSLAKRWYIPSYALLADWNVHAASEVFSDDQISSIPLAGDLCKICSMGGPEVYVIKDGLRQHIKSDRIFPYYHVGWADLRGIDPGLMTAVGVTEGPPIGFLAHAAGSPDVYLVNNGYKFYIPDADTVFRWGYTFDEIQSVDPAVMAAVPVSPKGLQMDMAVTGSPDIYLVSRGQRLHIPNMDVMRNWGLDPYWTSNVTEEMSDLLPQGRDLSRLVVGSGPQVYFIQGSLKHYVSSFSKVKQFGLSQNDLVQVDDALLNSRPTGSPL